MKIYQNLQKFAKTQKLKIEKAIFAFRSMKLFAAAIFGKFVKNEGRNFFGKRKRTQTRRNFAILWSTTCFQNLITFKIVLEI